jgi:8-oxo-dGTP pyrophosphatase MutT (NUDIX family)
VPGGKLETGDYTERPKDAADYWYNVLEAVVTREVKEEVGLTIANVDYVTSLATIHAEGTPSLVISVMAEWQSGEVILQEEETDQFAWVSLEEARGYDLVDGILDELVMADNKVRGLNQGWQRTAQ